MSSGGRHSLLHGVGAFSVLGIFSVDPVFEHWFDNLLCEKRVPNHGSESLGFKYLRRVAHVKF
jgi:hypothetical protein